MPHRVYIRWAEGSVSHRTTTCFVECADLAFEILSSRQESFARMGARAVNHTVNGLPHRQLILNSPDQVTAAPDSDTVMNKTGVLMPDFSRRDSTQSVLPEIGDMAWMRLCDQIDRHIQCGALALELYHGPSLRHAIRLDAAEPVIVRWDGKDVRSRWTGSWSLDGQAAFATAVEDLPAIAPPDIEHETQLGSLDDLFAPSIRR